MNLASSIILSALLTWALKRTSEDIGNKFSNQVWFVIFFLFTICFTNIK
jgi:hypothetical protein